MNSAEVVVQLDDMAGSCFENTYIRSAPSSLFPQPFDQQAARGKALQAWLGKLVKPLWVDLNSARPWVCVSCGKAPASLATHFTYQTPDKESKHVMHIIIKSAPICTKQTCLRQAEDTTFPGTKAEKERGSEAVKACNFCGVWDSAEKTTLKKCSQCKAVSYCSKACQKQDWPKHKPACNTTPQPASIPSSSQASPKPGGANPCQFR